MGVSDASDSRLAVLTRWVAEDLGFAGSRLEPASADASFRRYFRLTRENDTYIVMDAPPQKEDSAPFVSVAKILAGIGLNVPVVLARDMRQGLLLLTDLGSQPYLDELTSGREVDRLYADAMQALLRLHAAGSAAASTLPAYDRALLRREMELMPQWFCGTHLGLELDGGERDLLERLFETLTGEALAQPLTFVHRDYHSRNLLLQRENNPGILDFQDAVRGPLTYDLVSLLKDCYIDWPAQRVRAWALHFRQLLLMRGSAAGADEAQFMRWFDFMGLQRHIKVLGIFARLCHRDGKDGYLKDLPRVLQYTRETAAQYPELREFSDFLATRIDPRFQARAGTRARAPT